MQIRSKNFELLLDGSWQSLPIEGFFVGLQISNPEENDSVRFRTDEAGAERPIAPDDKYELVSPDVRVPFANNIMVCGTAGQRISGERWIYDYQAEGQA